MAEQNQIGFAASCQNSYVNFESFFPFNTIDWRNSTDSEMYHMKA